MMSKMGAMFVLLLLFTLASSQQEGDVQARKTSLKSDFYRALRGCTLVNNCEKNGACNGDCHCKGKICKCGSSARPWKPGCACTCRNAK
uniref:Conotoxin superfamily S n=1 Tax=Conus magus TaxID=6492 RepID=A0A5P8I0V6_CONMA|nr:conotoxin superfamily S [Conus magus]